MTQEHKLLHEQLHFLSFVPGLGISARDGGAMVDMVLGEDTPGYRARGGPLGVSLAWVSLNLTLTSSPFSMLSKILLSPSSVS